MLSFSWPYPTIPDTAGFFVQIDDIWWTMRCPDIWFTMSARFAAQFTSALQWHDGLPHRYWACFIIEFCSLEYKPSCYILILVSLKLPRWAQRLSQTISQARLGTLPLFIPDLLNIRSVKHYVSGVKSGIITGNCKRMLIGISCTWVKQKIPKFVCPGMCQVIKLRWLELLQRE